MSRKWSEKRNALEAIGSSLAGPCAVSSVVVAAVMGPLGTCRVAGLNRGVLLG